jgi:hypothetical protein
MSSSHSFHSVDKITFTSQRLGEGSRDGAFTVLKITIRDSRGHAAQLDLFVNDDVECKVNMEGGSARDLAGLLFRSLRNVEDS